VNWFENLEFFFSKLFEDFKTECDCLISKIDSRTNCNTRDFYSL